MSSGAAAHRRRAARPLAATLALVLVLASACTIGPQDEPQSLDLELATDPLPLASTTTTPEPSAREVTFVATLYLVDDVDRLVPVTRRLRASEGAAQRLVAVVEALVRGPTTPEASAGLRSVVPSTVTVQEVVVDDETVIVDLSAAFAQIGGRSEQLAVGQVVATVTTFPGAQRLLLRLDGRPTDLPLPDGALTDEPVTLGQFSSLFEVEAPPTTGNGAPAPATAPPPPPPAPPEESDPGSDEEGG